MLDNHLVELGTQGDLFCFVGCLKRRKEQSFANSPRVRYKPSSHPCGEKKLAIALCTWSPNVVTELLPSVSYNPGKGSFFGKDGLEDFEDSFLNGPKENKSQPKEFPENDKSDTVENVEVNEKLRDDAKYVTPKKCNGIEYMGDGTRSNPWIFMDPSKPASPSKSFPSTAELCRRATQENNGKRKRMPPKKLSDYMVTGNGSKRQGRTKETPDLGK